MGPTTNSQAAGLLQASAEAHGLPALTRLADVNVRYAGTWPPLIGRLQPALVDAGFRGGSEERLLLRQGLIAQAHTGPAGRKQVVRRWAPDGVVVWFNDEPAADAERRAAAALVADGYALFLLGPMLLAGSWGERRALELALANPERLRVNGYEHDCDVLRIRLVPGLGFAASEQLALYIDRDARLLRRVRFSLNGLESTQGAVAEVDAWGHAEYRGVRWPTRFRERLLRPLPLRVHDWALTGLDVDRGLTPAEVEGPQFAGRASIPAAETHCEACFA